MESRNKQFSELEQIAKRQTVEEWARIAIIKFQKSLQSKKIVDTRHLLNSFTKELRSHRGDVNSVILKFAMYGRFRDMGVGSGVKAYERKTNKANLVAARAYGANVPYMRRQPKRWYNKVKVRETLKLQEILIRDLGDDIIQWISTDFKDEITTGI